MWKEDIIMSFNAICSNCGAPSSPSVGVCPFCKSVMTQKKSVDTPTISKLRELYIKGDIEKALLLARQAEKEKPKLLENASFILLYVQTLIETDGPSSKTKALLTQAYLKDAENAQLSEYREIVEAKSHLSHEKNDMGEQALVNIMRRSPKNPHALFLLGTHLCWIENEYPRAIQLLERCVVLRPNWLKANGCLAALYIKVGNETLSQRYMRRCVTLSKDAKTKEYFKSLIP